LKHQIRNLRTICLLAFCSCEALKQTNTDFNDKPKIVSNFPVTQAKQVLLTTPIIVNFSQEMSTSSVEQSMTVVGQKTVTGTYAWTNSDTTLTFTPSELEYFVTYTVTISQSARDKSGKSLAETFTSTFATFNSNRMSNTMISSIYTSDLLYDTASNRYALTITMPNNALARFTMADSNLAYLSDIDLTTGPADNPWSGGSRPNMAYGSGYYMATYQHVEPTFNHPVMHRFDSNLNLSGSFVVTRSNTNGNAFSAEIIFNQTDFSVFWGDNRHAAGGGWTKIFYARMTTAGALVDLGGFTNLQISTGTTGGSSGNSANPAATSDGTNIGVVWQESGYSLPNGELYFAKTNLNGAKIALAGTDANNELRVTVATGTAWSPSVAYGGHFGICYHDDRTGTYRIYFSRVNGTTGSKVAIADPEPDGVNDDDLLLSENSDDAQSCQIIYNSAKNEYAVVWRGLTDANYNEIFFQRINATTGAKINNNIRVTDAKSANYPSIAWTGSSYAVSYADTIVKRVFLVR